MLILTFYVIVSFTHMIQRIDCYSALYMPPLLIAHSATTIYLSAYLELYPGQMAGPAYS
jgi:hypothetical protein